MGADLTGPAAQMLRWSKGEKKKGGKLGSVGDGVVV